MRVKIEINTYETSPARPHRRASYRVESAWWSGTAEVLTFQPEELVATKLRALFQRRKGRDLFDLWVALTVLGLDPAEIVARARTDRTASTAERARLGLEDHLADAGFRADLLPLSRVAAPDGYDIDTAGALVPRRGPRSRLNRGTESAFGAENQSRRRRSGAAAAGEYQIVRY